jgi:hypothetical protein
MNNATFPLSVALGGDVCVCNSKVPLGLCLLAWKMANCRFSVPSISAMQAALLVTTTANSLQDQGFRFGSHCFGEDSASEGMKAGRDIELGMGVGMGP